MQAERDPYAALRYRDYRLLISGAVLASIGVGAQTVAVGWELYERTKSARILGLVGLAQFLPILAFALPAGQAADRYSRKLIFQLGQCSAVLASLTLAFLSYSQGPVPLILGCLFVIGMGRAFGAPARQSLLPQIVPPEVLPNAVAWNSTGWQIANVGGPALGGLLLWAIPPDVDHRFAVTYCFAAGCSQVCALLVTPIQPLVRPRPAEPRSLATLLAGIRFVWRTEMLLAAITLDLFAVLLGGATALLPIFASDILHVGPEGLGVLRAAPAVGAFFMALAMAHGPPLRRPGRALMLSVIGFGVTTIVFGLSTSFTLSLVMLVAMGAFDNVSVVVRGTLMQLLTPDEMRGRVAAVNVVFISSSNELGEFESGETAEWFGAPGAVVVGGLGTIAVVLLVGKLWPKLYHVGPLHTLRPGTIEPLSERKATEGSAPRSPGETPGAVS